VKHRILKTKQWLLPNESGRSFFSIIDLTVFKQVKMPSRYKRSLELGFNSILSFQQWNYAYTSGERGRVISTSLLNYYIKHELLRKPNQTRQVERVPSHRSGKQLGSIQSLV